MVRPKKILHIIESLGIGGAERSLIQMVNGLSEFDHIVVVLARPNDLAVQITNGKVINLGVTSFWGYLRAILRIRKLIKENSVTIVHAQLFKSTIVGRLAAGRKYPFVFTLQSMLGEDLFRKSFPARVLERLTCRPSNFLIAVSNEALHDYEKYISRPKEKRVISNSIDIRFFATVFKELTPQKKIRAVAVGNLKPLKNFDYLLDAFREIGSENFELDIYGEGVDRKHLETRIRVENLRVSLKGNAADLYERLKDYDIYLHCSKYEGASLAVFEAMASGLPLIVSDIPVLHENTGGFASFVNLSDSKDLAQKLILIQKGESNINTIGKKGFEWVKKIAHPDVVFTQIADFYDHIYSEIRSV
ncbi:MAG TPA: glycosyltransferase [Chitinophagaceae bacterium]|nr:glycosyltransferase [Chitinophagaceae bacterium]